MSEKAIVFDLGAVMVEWNPQKIVSAFSSDIDLQQCLLTQVYEHEDWLSLDRGVLSESQMIENVSERTGLGLQRITDLFTHTKASLCAIEDSVNILAQAKEAGLSVYCLSNICDPFFDYLSERYGFFEWFDGEVVSARENVIKPELAIFECLLQRYDLAAEQTLFVDDREDNIHAARQLGFQTVHFHRTPFCYQSIRAFIDAAS